MSGWHAHQGDPNAAATNWQGLSGEQPQVPEQPAQPMQPIHGGWQQPWQDEHGQWHYPYAEQQPVQAPPYADVQYVAQPEPVQYAMPVPEAPVVAEPDVSPFVSMEQLEPVGPPRYAAPVRVAQDPRQRTLAAVIIFISLLIGLWAILGFMGSMAKTLTSMESGSAKLELQLAEGNKGLATLVEKTGHLEKMGTDSKALKGLLGTIDGDMGVMLTGVDEIAQGMGSMEASLGTLDGELTRVNEINSGMAGTLGTINEGLAQQVGSVRTMRRDVQATGTVLGTLPGRLEATNKRLGFVNNSVNIMGCQGITNNLEVDIFLGPLRNGSAKVYATVVPPGAWGTKADGVTPC